MYRLLIVDDEPAVVEGILKSTNWAEYNISPPLSAFNGSDALTQCRLHKPDIVITDIRMPGMDGLKLSAQILKITPHTKIIILSAHGEFEYAREAIGLKIGSYLLKPVKRKILLEEVKKMTGELDEYFSGKQEELPPDSGEAVSIREVQKYIQAHIMTGISLDTAAAHMSLSSSYLSKLFKEKTGIAFIDYVKQEKIERAKQLLEKTNLKVYEICNSLSYNNIQYFTEMFKLHTGMTPTEYRQKPE